jgi:hypothetical protein
METSWTGSCFDTLACTLKGTYGDNAQGYTCWQMHRGPHYSTQGLHCGCMRLWLEASHSQAPRKWRPCILLLRALMRIHECCVNSSIENPILVHEQGIYLSVLGDQAGYNHWQRNVKSCEGQHQWMDGRDVGQIFYLKLG